jgi:hypothetical protein
MAQKRLSGLILEQLETIPDASVGLRLDSFYIEVMQIRDNTIKAAKIKQLVVGGRLGFLKGRHKPHKTFVMFVPQSLGSGLSF